jgi:hypothetical protein
MSVNKVPAELLPTHSAWSSAWRPPYRRSQSRLIQTQFNSKDISLPKSGTGVPRRSSQPT